MKSLRRVLVVLLFAVVLHAQDAQQLLQLRVGYGTLKASTTLTDDQRAELTKLEASANEAAGSGKFAEAMKQLYHGMTVMRNEPWTAWSSLQPALRIKPDHAVLEPGQKITIEVTQIYPSDGAIEGQVNFSIALLAMRGDEPLKLMAQHAMERWAPRSIGASVPEIDDGNYRLAMILKSPLGKTIVRATPVHIEHGLADKEAAAKAREAKLAARLAGNPALASVEYHMELYDLASSGAINFQNINFANELQQAAAQMDALEAKRNPFATQHGDFRKAYRSKVDNTLQPYRMFVPSAYDGSKPFPLIVALHGMGGDENTWFDFYNDGAFKVEAEKRGYLVACPKGRQPASMYLGTAEQDVMDVLAEVLRDYRVDANRVYLTGHSMGGYGTWSISMNHPEVFAAIAPISGGGNPGAMSKLAHVPQLVVHGDADKTVPVDRSRVMVEAAKKLGYEVKYIEVPGGSHIGVAAPAFEDVFDWFDAHTRMKASAATQ